MRQRDTARASLKRACVAGQELVPCHNDELVESFFDWVDLMRECDCHRPDEYQRRKRVEEAADR